MIDTHTHIYLEEFDEDRIEVVRRAREAGVERVILPNVDFDTVQDMRLHHKSLFLLLGIGLVPIQIEPYLAHGAILPGEKQLSHLFKPPRGVPQFHGVGRTGASVEGNR